MADNIKATSTSTGLDQTLKIQTTDSSDVDRAGADKLTTWQSDKWTKYNGYYEDHISVKSVMIKLGMWTVGKGFKADKKTTKILNKIIGWGKDSANSVFANQKRVEHVNGDSYAEIITKDKEPIKDDGSNLINLKPLNPGTLKHHINSQGMLEKYSQVNTNGTETDLRLDQVFHLCLNRNADEIHGTSDIGALITFLDKIKQLDEDMTVMFHRFVVPLIIWKLNTDDPTAIAAFKANEKVALNKGDNLFIPNEAVDWSLMEPGKGIGNVLNPMDWRNKWSEEVIKGGGVPALIMAIEAGTTEASAKMVYLAWQQVIEDSQRTLEDQIRLQLHLEVKFEFPARIEENLGEDEGKDGDINTSKKSEVKITTKSIDQKSTKPPT